MTNEDAVIGSSETVFVGRERELAAMHAALAQARAGRGRLVLVAGEPGIGKSALVDAFATEVRTSGVRVLWGAAWEGGGAPAYWPWVQVLRQAARPGGDRPPGRPPSHWHPSAYDLLSPLLAQQPVAGEAASESDRFAMFDAVAGVLTESAGAAPLVVVLEDLHAAGLPSVLLLEFVARHTRHEPVLLVATYREIDARLDPRLGDTIAALAGAAISIAVPPLSEREVRSLIAPVLPDVPAPVVAAILDRTSGNPLFALQVARLLAQDGAGPAATVPGSPIMGTRGAAEVAASPIPAGIRQAVRRRVAAVGAASGPPWQALTTAAALGREFELAAVAAVLESPAADVLALLDGAIRAGLITEAPGEPGRYRFAHALVAETVEGDLTPVERAALHHRIAGVLAGWGASAARIAHHYLGAVAVGGADGAVAFARSAGQEALAALAFEEAADHFRRALSALTHVVDSDPEQRCELTLSLGTALMKGGNLSEAESVLARASEQARQCANPVLLARAALLRTEHLDFNAANEAAIALLDEVVRAVGPGDGPAASAPAGDPPAAAAPVGDTPERAEALALLARAYARLGIAARPADSERAAAAARLAVEVAHRSGDPAAMAVARAAELHEQWGRHDPRSALATAEEIAALAAGAGNTELAADAHTCRIAFSLELGDIAGARRALAAVDEIADRTGLPAVRFLGLTRAATLASLSGRTAEALALTERAWQAGTRVRLPDADAVHWAQLFAIWAQAGLPPDREERMTRILTRLVAHSAMPAAHEAPLAVLEAARGDRSRARVRCGSLVDALPEIPRDMVYVWTLAMLADACVATGAADRADPVYRELLPLADRFVVAAGATVCIGSVHHYLAGLARLLGDVDAGERHYRQAIDRHRRADALGMLARSLAGYAELLRERDGAGDRERATLLYGEASDIARRWGLVVPAAGEVAAFGGPDEAEGVGRSGRDDSATPATAPAAAFELLQEGDFWTVRRGEGVFRVADSTGLRYLDVLIRHPDRDVGALELVRLARSGTSTSGPGTSAGVGSAGVVDVDHLRATSAPNADLGEAIDAQARAAYRTRLAELDEDLDEATRLNDPERAARIEYERDFLVRELAHAVGLAGRPRVIGSDVERARVNVTRAIRTAIRRIGAHDPELARHLNTAVRTGGYCRYRSAPP